MLHLIFTVSLIFETIKLCSFFKPSLIKYTFFFTTVGLFWPKRVVGTQNQALPQSYIENLRVLWVLLIFLPYRAGMKSKTLNLEGVQLIHGTLLNLIDLMCWEGTRWEDISQTLGQLSLLEVTHIRKVWAVWQSG